MSSGSFRPAASLDDAHWRRNSSQYESSNVDVAFGTTDPIDALFRFPVAVPPGMEIISAQLVLCAQRDQPGTCPVSVHVVLADNQTALSSVSEAQALSLSAGAAWEPGDWTANGVYVSPDLAALVQQVVDRPAWTSGNHIVVVIRGAGSTSNLRAAWAYDSGYASKYAALEISWEVPSVPLVRGSGHLYAPSTPLAFPPSLGGSGAIHTPSVISGVIVLPLVGVGNLPAPSARLGVVAPALAGVGILPRPTGIWSLPAADLPAAQTIYTLTLTGSANGLADITIPMASFQTRLNEGGVHYMSAVVPDSRRWAAAIAARNLGQWIVRKGYRLRDGSESLAEIVRVNFTSLAWSRGSSGDAATIYGNATVPVVASKSVTTTGIQYESLDTNGKRRIRCDVSKDLAPGDWCLWSGGSMQVGEIVHYVGAEMAFMEVSES